jgi:hypothetical protein
MAIPVSGINKCDSDRGCAGVTEQFLNASHLAGRGSDVARELVILEVGGWGRGFIPVERLICYEVSSMRIYSVAYPFLQAVL